MQLIHCIYELAVAAGILAAGAKSLSPYFPVALRWAAWAVAAIRRAR